MICFSYMQSPVGRLLLAGDEDGLRIIAFRGGQAMQLPTEEWREAREPFQEAVRQLDAYFSGELRHFDLKLSPVGTPFQLAVWRALQEIPYGETVTYGELARKIGRPKASRAVGLANGRNPLPIVVPCHRVIGSGGDLTGYGGGLEIKRRLLDLERGQSLLVPAAGSL